MLPAATVAAVGATVMLSMFGEPTVSVWAFVITPSYVVKEPVIELVPIPTAVARPVVAPTVATPGVPEVQFAVVGCVVPSPKVAIAVNCCVRPSATDGLAGDTCRLT